MLDSRHATDSAGTGSIRVLIVISKNESLLTIASSLILIREREPVGSRMRCEVYLV